MEGLTVGYGQGDVEVTTGTQSDESIVCYICNRWSYCWYPKSEDNVNASDVESTGIGISAVNDDLTISYGSNVRNKSDLKTKSSSDWCFIHSHCYCSINTLLTT